MNQAELNDRQRQFVERVAGGMNTQQAAKLAGFSPSYSRKSSRMLRHPNIAAAIAGIREKGREKSAYTLGIAMDEALDVITFAKENGNAMAFCKAVELRAKLSGLLIDRVEVFTADLRGALLEASKRVVHAAPGSYHLEQLLEGHSPTEMTPPVVGQPAKPSEAQTAETN